MAVALTAASSAHAATITVNTRSGGGGATGTITSVTPVINCATGSICSATFTTPASFTLTAAPGANTASPTWVGCTTFSGNTCTLTNLTGNRSVTATFPPSTWPLTVRPAGTNGATGTVTVAVTPPVACTNTAGCVAAVPANTTVAVTAAAGPGSVFTSWSGACTGTGACNVLANAAKSVTANFARSAYDVFVGFFGGNGTVTSTGAAANANCVSPGTGTCSALVATGGSAVFTATPNAMSEFTGWGGCSSVSGAACTVTNVTANRTVTAGFQARACNSCHGVPPPSHGANWNDCSQCHTGYTFSSINPDLHLNGQIDVSPPAPEKFEPGSGLKIEVISATIVGGQRPVVRLKITDELDQPFNVTSEIVPQGTAPLAKLRNMSFSIAQLSDPNPAQNATANLGAAWYSKIGSTATATSISTSESGTGTAAVSRYAAVADQPGVYDYTLAAFVTTGAISQYNGGVYDASKPTRVVVFGARWSDGNATSATNEATQYPAWGFIHLVPAGGAPSTTHQVVTNDKCQGCHGYTNVNIHSLARPVAEACEVCHNPTRGGAVLESLAAVGLYNRATSTSTAANGLWDFKNMVHGVHNGQVLKGGAAGAASDFSKIKMAPSHSLYFENGTPATVTVIDPELTTSCEICHNGADANNAYTRPSRVACGSCHASVNFTSGEGHDGGVGQQNDDNCTTCHPSTGNIVASNGTMILSPVNKVHGRWFEPAHRTNFVEELATNAIPLPAAGHDFKVTLVSVTADAAGLLTYTADFSLDGAAFSVNPLPNASFRLATCELQIAGPTQSDYTTPATGGTAQSCTTVANWIATGTAGRFTYTGTAFLNGRPDGDYTAAFAIMIQRVVTVPAGRPGAGDQIRKPFSANPNFLTITKTGGATAVVSAGGTARRAVVSFDKCNNCHVDLGFHSNRGRKGPDYCATCHNPKLDNSGRARFTVAEAYTIPGTTNLGYLPESVSMNVFIHRIHMGDELPSVAYPATRSPLSTYRGTTGKIAYGATRSAFVGLDANTPPDISDFSEFAMPNPMSRCDQCHISMDTAGLPAGARAPVERNYRLCNSITPTWASEPWCNVTATSGAPAAGVLVITPPQKAVCTSCHDSAATDSHADAFTSSPMTAGAVENCGGCHGAGKMLDATVVHRPRVGNGTASTPSTNSRYIP